MVNKSKWLFVGQYRIETWYDRELDRDDIWYGQDKYLLYHVFIVSDVWYTLDNDVIWYIS